jgi:hypothetical protein
MNIPFVGIMMTIVKRTKSRNYFYQVFPTMGILILVTVIAFSSTIRFNEDSIETIIYIIVLVILLILESILLRLHVQGVKNNKKPLWFYSFFQDTFESYSSTILSQQALNIADLENGYTQRPFFSSFSEIKEICPTLESYHNGLNNYIQFLIERSELIDSEVRKEKVILYPRVLLGHTDFGVGIKYLWSLWLKIYHRRGLTTITIDYSSEEISLTVAREDYEWLGNVTYHILAQKILNQFKLSIIAFLNSEWEKSYSILFRNNIGE